MGFHCDKATTLKQHRLLVPTLQAALTPPRFHHVTTMEQEEGDSTSPSRSAPEDASENTGVPLLPYATKCSQAPQHARVTSAQGRDASCGSHQKPRPQSEQRKESRARDEAWLPAPLGRGSTEQTAPQVPLLHHEKQSKGTPGALRGTTGQSCCSHVSSSCQLAASEEMWPSSSSTNRIKEAELLHARPLLLRAPHLVPAT